MCDYDPSQHFSDESRQINLQRCISKTMKKMSEPQKCVSYMSGVLSSDAKTQSCSISDVSNICSNYKSQFTISDARKLCSMKNDAEYNFWKEKKQM